MAPESLRQRVEKEMRLVPKKVREAFEAVAPTAMQSMPEYKAAVKFSKEIEAEGVSDCDLVWDYAKDLFDRTVKIYASLDDKANDIIKYLGGGAGLFTVGIISRVTPENTYLIYLSLPSFVAAMVAIFFAVLARKPNLMTHPPTVKDLYEFCRAYNEQAKANFLGQWHLACVGALLAVKTKARYVQVATWLFFLAIALLTFPVAGAAYLQH